MHLYVIIDAKSFKFFVGANAKQSFKFFEGANAKQSFKFFEGANQNS